MKKGKKHFSKKRQIDCLNCCRLTQLSVSIHIHTWAASNQHRLLQPKPPPSSLNPSSSTAPPPPTPTQTNCPQSHTTTSFQLNPHQIKLHLSIHPNPLPQSNPTACLPDFPPLPSPPPQSNPTACLNPLPNPIKPNCLPPLQSKSTANLTALHRTFQPAASAFV